jgi:Spy/CpxP family protein refolding chaperone
MLRTILGLALTLLVCACSGEPELSRPDTGPQEEKTVYAALTKVSATDEERVAVLNAYDRSNDRLRQLASQSRQILRDWRRLDRRAPDFSAKVDALAAQWAGLNSDEMKVRAGYEHDVAAVLTPKQWERWQKFMRSSPVPRNYDDYDNPAAGRMQGP